MTRQILPTTKEIAELLIKDPFEYFGNWNYSHKEFSFVTRERVDNELVFTRDKNSFSLEEKFLEDLSKRNYRISLKDFEFHPLTRWLFGNKKRAKDLAKILVISGPLFLLERCGGDGYQMNRYRHKVKQYKKGLLRNFPKPGSGEGLLCRDIIGKTGQLVINGYWKSVLMADFDAMFFGMGYRLTESIKYPVLSLAVNKD